MIKFLILTLSLLFWITVASACESEVAYSWETNIGMEFFGGSPLVTKLGDDQIAVTETRRNKPGFYNMTLHAYSLSGEYIKNCTTEINVGAVLSDQEIFRIGKTKVAVTWLTNHDDILKGALIVHVVDFETCTFYKQKIEIHNSTTQRKYYEQISISYNSPSYSIIPGHNDTAELFIWSSVLCEDAVCRISLPGLEKIEKPVQSFMKGDGPNFWKIVPVDSFDSLRGFFYISRKPLEEALHYIVTAVAKIVRLDHAGKVLTTLETGLYLGSSTTLSSGYGKIVLCGSVAETLKRNCQVFDSSLNQTLVLKDFKDYEAQSATEITKDGGLLLTKEFCTREEEIKREINTVSIINRPIRGFYFPIMECKAQEVRVIKVAPDGTFDNDYHLFNNEGRLYLESFYTSFVNERRDIYCTIKKKLRGKDKPYVFGEEKLDLQVKCLKMLASPC